MTETMDLPSNTCLCVYQDAASFKKGLRGALDLDIPFQKWLNYV